MIGYGSAMIEHPLDRPAWAALTGPQAELAVADGPARRFDPDYGLFLAAEDDSLAALEALGRLVRAHGEAGLFEQAPPRGVPGARQTAEAPCWQMVAAKPLEEPATDVRIEVLTEADAPEMLALATLTKPGPFFGRTHQLGRFVGVRVDGRLAAMAGERMRLPGFTEVSAVCTDPAFRGRGYAAALTLEVGRRIQARGEAPFLHCYAGNTGAIRLYESLGFAFRTTIVLSVLARD